MLASIRNLTVATLFLVTLAIVYHKTVVPWLTPISVTPVALKPHEQNRRIENVSDLFPQGSWQRQSPTQLQTPDAMLLFEHWEQIKDNDDNETSGWRLWPITVVMGRGMSSELEPDPIVLESNDGATITFDGSLDMMAGGAPPIRRGRLIGDVKISRLQSDRPIRLETSEVNIDRKKIWTTEQIQLQMGDVRMVGRDLTVNLTSTSSLSKTNQTPEPDRLELIYLDELTLPLEESDDPKSGGVISIGCSGLVEYDFALDTLQLTDAVRLMRTAVDGTRDQFDCDQLQMAINRPTANSAPRELISDWISSVTATGSPLVADMPSWDLGVKADTLNWDSKKGRLAATGERGIEIRRGEIRARLASLHYEFDAANPTAIGTTVVDGVGLIEMAGNDVPLRWARWKRRLEIRPTIGNDSSSTKQTRVPIEIFVDGGFEAQTVDGGTMTADTVQGVLTPDPANTKAWLPERFDVRDNIRLDTAQIAVVADQLRLYFADDPSPSTPQSAQATTSMGQLVRQPQDDQSPTAPVARSRPTIQGRTINAQVMRSASGMTARKLSVVDDVVVSHTLLTGGVAMPARLTGKVLQFVNDGGSDILQLKSDGGEPAKLELGDGFFIGPEIQVRPLENLIWINDAGEFRIPSTLLPTGTPSRDPQADTLRISQSTPSSIQWINPPHCLWRGEMLFDGKSARLTGGVDIDASLVQNQSPWDIKLRGETLQVDLSQPIELRSVDSMKAATVSQLSLLGSEQRPVFAEAIGRDANQAQISRHLFHAERLTLQPSKTQSSMLEGIGPGWYRGWMAAKDDASYDPNQDSNQSTLINNGESLTGVHLVFQERMVADLSRQDLHFQSGVRVAMQNVESWDSVLEASQIIEPAIGTKLLNCDRLRMSVDRSAPRVPGIQPPPAWEVQAEGGIAFQTRSENGLLHGTAALATYSANKDLFTARGVPGQPATINQVRPDGTPGANGELELFAIRPSTMKVESAVFLRVNVSGNPSGNR
jgi:hypothetical protein